MNKGVNKTKLKKYSRREFIVASTVTGISIAVLGCSKSKDLDPSKEQGKDMLYITNIIVPAKVTLQLPANFMIRGNGFAMGDKLIFTSLSDDTKTITIDLKSVTQTDCSLIIPATFTSGRYRVEVIRKDKSLYLGQTIIEIDYGIADKPGMTVKGMVHVAGVGLAGVVVSDGVEVVTTDEKGIYYLPSKKEKDFTFISVPSGHEVETNTVLPVFYKHFEAAVDVVETINFELKPVNNDKHVVLALGDMHLANRNNDVSQFQKGFLPDAAQSITKYKNEGYKVYGLTLGDMTWDAYWYSSKYGFAQYLDLVKGMGIPIYHTMGNHDNDPYIDSDWLAEGSFRKSLGPTYYSFNIGKIHYIVLDNIEYINTGGTQGTLGSRDYNSTLVAAQVEWLKKDLATITDKSTPVVVSMHIQLNKAPSVNETASLNLSNAIELINAFNGFTDVNFITGHTHVCYAYENREGFMEHNSGAVCATWWWTGKDGYAGNHICKDGSPGGYAIWKFNDRNYQWRYKSIGYGENYQFRAYDLNKVHITTAKFAPKASEADMKTYSAEYANPNTNNEILVNVWGYDKRWKVEMLENGTTPLAVTRVSVLDPLHVVSYEAFILNGGNTPTSAFTTGKTAHMFKAKALGATTPIVIKVTDRFGNVYTETMNRPKDFVLTMS